MDDNMDERENLIEKYKYLAGLRSGEYLSKDEFLREYSLTVSDLLRAGFDGFPGLAAASGGKVVNSKQIYSDETLLDDICKVQSKIGKFPSMAQYKAFGKFSVALYKRRFGSWTRAVEDAKVRSGIPASLSTEQTPQRLVREMVTSNSPPAGDFLKLGIAQFSQESQIDASQMSSHYAKLYCLECQMRSTIASVLSNSVGESWWVTCVPQSIRDNATKNLKAEEGLGVTPRSERSIDYTTLGELGVIVDFNWKYFASVFKNQEAMKRIMRDLNMLRAFVAHCTPLPPDEVIRLDLNISDWLRQIR